MVYEANIIVFVLLLDINIFVKVESDFETKEI